VPAPFQRKALRVLDSIYKFVGGQTGPNQFALEASIQPVHDMSRMSELAGLGAREGFWILQTAQSHAAGGELRDAINPYIATAINAGWPAELPDDLRVWVIDCFGYTASGTGNFALAEITLSYPAVMVGPSDLAAVVNEQLLYRADTESAITVGNEMLTNDNGPVIQARLPRRVEPGSNLNFQTEATGVTTIRLCALLWVGQRGTYPAGLA